jgi:spore germination protein KC
LRFPLIGILIICTIVLTGCWSRVEINDSAFATSIFVDKGTDGKIELTLSFPLTNRMTPSSVAGVSQTGNPYTTVTKRGKSISEAYRKIQSDLPRRINWGHTRTIILGEDFAKEGILQILEFVVREPSFNLTSAILVSPGKAKDVAALIPAFERFPNEVLREFTNKKNTLDTSVKDFLETENGDLIVGFLSKAKQKMISEKGIKGVWVGTNGMALFKNYKMIGKVNQRVGRGALWLKNKMENSGINIPSPTDKKNISLLVLTSKTIIRPSKANPYAFDVFVKAEDDVLESNSDIDLTDPTKIKQIEDKAGKEIKGRIEEVFKQSQKEKSDVFELGSYLSWYKPKIWEASRHEWRAIYQDKVKINIHVDLKIKRSGNEKNPFWIKEKNNT